MAPVTVDFTTPLIIWPIADFSSLAESSSMDFFISRWIDSRIESEKATTTES